MKIPSLVDVVVGLKVDVDADVDVDVDVNVGVDVDFYVFDDFNVLDKS